MSAALAVVLASSLSVAAPEPPAAELEARVQEALDAENYAEASALLREAWEQTDEPDYLYMRGEAERLGGDCGAAVLAFEEFLLHSEDEAARAAARGRVEECRPQNETAPDGPPARAAEPRPQPPPPPIVEPPPPLSPPRPWHRDPWGGVLAGVGLATLAAGIGIFARAKLDERRAGRAFFYDGYESSIDRAVLLSRVGIALTAIGSAAVLGAIIRYAAVARKAKRR